MKLSSMELEFTTIALSWWVQERTRELCTGVEKV